MSSAPIITLRDVGKRFVKYEDRPTLIEGITKVLRRHKRGRLWAIRHVDLEVGRGETVGVIGRNGSGKSTLLSMLAGVTSPTEGVVTVRGQIAPLLSLGVGFDSELTGRENVFINGTILGMTRREVESRFDDIVAFAEMSDFIDTPVKFYSSGMLVRLGFSVAISARPDILLVDEVLAVGDVGFQQRSFNRMMDLQEQGTTVLVVSHNVNAIQRMAKRALVLHDGAVRFAGATPEAIGEYYDALRLSFEEESEGAGSSVHVTDLEISGPDGADTAVLHAHDEATVRMTMRFTEKLDNPIVWFSVHDDGGTIVFSERSNALQERGVEVGTEYALTVRVRLGLVAGSYTLAGGVHWIAGGRKRLITSKKTVYLAGRSTALGIVDLAPQIDIESRGTPAVQPPVT